MKMKSIAVGIFRVLAVLLVLLLLVVVGLTLPECSRLRVMVVNNTPEPVEEVTLKLGGEIIWSGRLAGLRGKRISVLRRLNGYFSIEGRYGGYRSASSRDPTATRPHIVRGRTFF